LFTLKPMSASVFCPPKSFLFLFTDMTADLQIQLVPFQS
jgi:hypothetical protein